MEAPPENQQTPTATQEPPAAAPQNAPAATSAPASPAAPAAPSTTTTASGKKDTKKWLYIGIGILVVLVIIWFLTK
jgi:hypothetical protein